MVLLVTEVHVWRQSPLKTTVWRTIQFHVAARAVAPLSKSCWITLMWLQCVIQQKQTNTLHDLCWAQIKRLHNIYSNCKNWQGNFACPSYHDPYSCISMTYTFLVACRNGIRHRPVDTGITDWLTHDVPSSSSAMYALASRNASGVHLWEYSTSQRSSFSCFSYTHRHTHRCVTEFTFHNNRRW